jgi:hypothetical protein
MIGAGVHDRWESSARVLAASKLVNVGMAMLWGFVVTYVFVRVLPLGEFRAFLLLVAFGNFTISAEFGVTNIMYNRLRRHWLGSAEGDFRLEEIGLLLSALMALIVMATIAVGVGIALGAIPTRMSALFLLFFVTACLNVITLLMKRTLAAVDRNLAWEALDLARRLLSLALLLAALAGLDIRVSVGLQLAVSLGAILAAMALVHRRTGMAMRQWIALRIGGGHVRRSYWRDARASVALTCSEIAAYNAPYFTIAMATHDVRPMLLFDFVFKLSRALSAAIRAMSEAALPRLTAAFYERRGARFRQLVGRVLAVSIAGALLAAGATLVAGQWLFTALFAGKAAIGWTETLGVSVILLALSVICVSVYLQGALGRFQRLLRQSLPFLMGSLLSVPFAMMLPGSFATMFVILYAATFVGTTALHVASLRRLLRELPA